MFLFTESSFDESNDFPGDKQSFPQLGSKSLWKSSGVDRFPDMLALDSSRNLDVVLVGGKRGAEWLEY